MSVEQERQWITGEEFGRERKRLIEACVPDDAPEFQELYWRVRERDDYLYESYGKQHYDEHYGKWIGISLDGQVILRDTASALIWDASKAFGDGNFCMRKLADPPGHRLLA